MFKTFNLKAAAAALVLVCTGSAAMAQSAVGNASFENAIAYDVPPVAGAWTAFFGGPASVVLAAEQNTTAPRTGTNALYLKVVGDAGNAFCGVQQPISGLQPGVSYTMKIWARKAGNVTNGVEYRMEWRNASGGIIGNQFALTTRIDAALTNTYQQFSLTAVAPAGAAIATLVVAAQSFYFDPVNPQFDTNVYIDDVEFAADPLPGQNACCFADGTCTVALTGACPSGSTAQAASTTCSPNNCPAPTGTCCASNGSCTVTTQAACVGTWSGASASCTPNNCPQPPGACCNPRTGACVVLDSALCTPLGTFRGAGTTCSPNQCPTPCPADFNGVGGVSVQDIFDFLTAWFNGCP